MIFPIILSSFFLMNANAGLRHSAGRIRSIHPGHDLKPRQGNVENNGNLVVVLQEEIQEIENEEEAILEFVNALEDGMSMPLIEPTANPIVTETPTASPSFAASFVFSTTSPTISLMASEMPSAVPTFLAPPSESPTVSKLPSLEPTALPTNSPTIELCGISSEDRETAILGILDQVANSTLIRDTNTSQGLAADWIISEDERQLCPDNQKIIQRWTLATMYFATGGDNWFNCFAGDQNCTTSLAFLGEDAFLSSSNECEWAGISCSVDACVTEIEFEENNLVGTIPTELGLLSDLVIWGMERGTLTGTIPSEMGRLDNLIFIDLDFNELSGTIPIELYNLVNLTQLDLNNNFLEGNVNELGAFTDLEFLQLHSNRFTGTIPISVGSFSLLSTFTLHENDFGGVVPTGLCSLVNDGTMESLIADCGGNVPKINCDCCTDCRPF